MRTLTAWFSLASMMGLAGCAGPTAMPAGVPVPPDTTTAREPSPTYPREPGPSPIWDEPPPVEPGPLHEVPEPIEAECVDTERLAFGFSTVEAATGARYLTITVINCETQPVDLPASPPITATDADGQPVTLSWDLLPAVGGDTISPGTTRYLHLKWRTSGRCERGAARIVVEIDGSRATRDDCFQLGGHEDVGIGGAVWSTEGSNPL